MYGFIFLVAGDLLFIIELYLHIQYVEESMVYNIYCPLLGPQVPDKPKALEPSYCLSDDF